MLVEELPLAPQKMVALFPVPTPGALPSTCARKRATRLAGGDKDVTTMPLKTGHRAPSQAPLAVDAANASSQRPLRTLAAHIHVSSVDTRSPWLAADSTTSKNLESSSNSPSLAFSPAPFSGQGRAGCCPEDPGSTAQRAGSAADDGSCAHPRGPALALSRARCLPGLTPEPLFAKPQTTETIAFGRRTAAGIGQRTPGLAEPAWAGRGLPGRSIASATVPYAERSCKRRLLLTQPASEGHPLRASRAGL